jgi:hypothetical protein
MRRKLCLALFSLPKLARTGNQRGGVLPVKTAVQRQGAKIRRGKCSVQHERHRRRKDCAYHAMINMQV